MTIDNIKEMLQNRINSLRNLAIQAYAVGDIDINLKYSTEADQVQVTLNALNNIPVSEEPLS